MTEFDFVSILLPAIIAGVISLVIMGIVKLGRTTEGTLSGTIKLEIVDKRVEKMEESINEIWSKVNEINRILYNNSYRLDRLERNGNGGGKSAI